jgi:hypothetical protein
MFSPYKVTSNIADYYYESFSTARQAYEAIMSMGCHAEIQQFCNSANHEAHYVTILRDKKYLTFV